MERRRIHGGWELLLGESGPHERRKILPTHFGHFPERQECVQRGMARGVGGVPESAAGRGGQNQSVLVEVSFLSEHAGRGLLAWTRRRARRKTGGGTGLLSERRRSISADVFWARGGGALEQAAARRGRSARAGDSRQNSATASTAAVRRADSSGGCGSLGTRAGIAYDRVRFFRGAGAEKCVLCHFVAAISL